MQRAVMFAVVLGLLAGPAAASADGAGDPRLAGAETWAFAIGNGMLNGDAGRVAERFEGYDLVVADGEEATAPEVAALRAQGTTVLAYLSVGTIEKWRSWYAQLKRFRLRAWRDWEDEWFADVSKPRLRGLIAGRIAPRILAKGFDGLFLDNADMIEPARHREQRAGMRKLVARLDALVDRRDGLLFAQNGFWGLRRFGILGHLDGWNREDVTWTYDFDRRRYVQNRPVHTREALGELERVAARGVFTTATNYTKRARGHGVARSVADACSVGALPYVGDIGLTARRLPRPPLHC